MIVENGILTKIDSSITLKFSDAFENVSNFISYSDETVNETENSFFEKEFRYSSDNSQFSYWYELSEMNLQNINISDKIYVEVKYTYSGIIEDIELVFNNIEFNVKYTVTPKTPNNMCVSECSTCNNELIGTCESGLQLYNQQIINKILCQKQQIDTIISQVQGHKVQYWQNVPNKIEQDVIFKEYTLRAVSEKSKIINVVVPNNEFPDDEINFQMMDLDFFESPFEVHLLKKQWEDCFGGLTNPKRKDIIYFTLIDKLFHIDAVELYRPMGSNSGTYYKVALVKYQDESSTFVTGDAKQELEDLMLNIEDTIGDDIDDELDKITKPKQFDHSVIADDNYNRTLHKEICIKDEILENNWSVISKRHYDLNAINSNVVAVEYKEKVSISDSLSISSWVNISSTNETVILNGYNSTLGLRVYSNSDGFNILINGNIYTFNYTDILNKWIGLIINISNDYKEINLSLYERKIFDKYANTEFDTKELDMIYTENKILINSLQNVNANYQLLGGNLKITNIRIFDKLIEQEQQSKILNQFLVKDNQHSLLIDNAEKDYQFDRFQ